MPPIESPSPRYDLLLVLVALELLFAFAVGLSCIVFSVCFFRHVARDSDSSTVAALGTGARRAPLRNYSAAFLEDGAAAGDADADGRGVAARIRRWLG